MIARDMANFRSPVARIARGANRGPFPGFAALNEVRSCSIAGTTRRSRRRRGVDVGIVVHLKAFVYYGVRGGSVTDS